MSHHALRHGIGRRATILTAALALSTVATIARSADHPRSPVGRRIAPFSAVAIDGRSWDWPGAQDPTQGPGPLTVVAFLGVECPLSTAYGPRLAGLADRYADEGVRLVGVMPNRQDDPDEIARYADRQGIAFPLLADPDQRIADRFGATRTPEVFVVDGALRIRYAGRVDDQYAQGGRRDRPARDDLRIALDELLEGRPVSVPEAEAAGCLIGRAPTDVGPAPTADDPTPPPTFADHVAPLLHAKCARCHRPDQVAPFSMDSYEDVAIWAPTIKEAVRARRMPPWGAAPGSGPFHDDLGLSDEQIDLIARWVDAGAPGGDLASAPAFPEFGDGWRLGEPDLVVTLPEYVVRPGDRDEWPTLSVTVPFPEGGRWIRAVEVLPGNPKVMHHLGLGFGPGGAAMAAMGDGGGEAVSGPVGGGFPGRGAGGGRLGALTRRRAGGDGEAPTATSGGLGAWAAGTPGLAYPEGVGVPIEAIDGRVTFTAAMHYHPTPDTVERDRTRIGLYFGEGPLRRVAKRAAAVYLPIVLQPGQADYEVRGRFRVDEDVRIISYGPHMHFRGKDMTYSVRYPDGSRETLLEVPRYDFNYQWVYRLVEPKPIPAGSTIEMVGHLDNSAANRNNPDPSATVRFGPESDDEMASAVFFYHAEHRTEPARPALGRRIDEWLAEHPEIPAFVGTARIGPPGLGLAIPAAIAVDRDGSGTLVLPGGGDAFAVELGRLQSEGDRLRADHLGGYGRATLDARLDGETLEGDVRVENDLKNPFLRLWDRGFSFRGTARRAPGG